MGDCEKLAMLPITGQSYTKNTERPLGPKNKILKPGTVKTKKVTLNLKHFY